MNFDEANRAIKEYIERADSEDSPKYRLNPNPHYHRENKKNMSRFTSLCGVVLAIASVFLLTYHFWLFEAFCNISVTAYVNDVEVSEGQNAIELIPGDTIKFVANSSLGEITNIDYFFLGDDDNSISGNEFVSAVPHSITEENKTLYIKPKAKDLKIFGDFHLAETTSVYEYTLFYADVQVEINEEIAVENETYSVKVGDTISIGADCQGADKVYISCAFKNGKVFDDLSDEEKIVDFYTDNTVITVPEQTVDGSETLYVQIHAVYYLDNEEKECLVSTRWKEYYLNYIEESSECQVNMYAEVNGEKMVNGGTYNVCPGDIITIEASSSESTINMIGYLWGSDEQTSYADIYDNHIEIIVPDGEVGDIEQLKIEAVANNDDGNPNQITKTGWTKFNLIYIEGESSYHKPYTKDYVEGKDIQVFVDGVKIENGSTVNITHDSKIRIYAYPKEDINVFYYKFGDDKQKAVIASDFRIKTSKNVAVGETITLMVNALYLDGLYIDDKKGAETTSEVYHFVVTDNLKKDIKILANGFEIENGSTTKVRAGTELNIYAYPSDEVVKIFYKLGSSETKYIDGSFKKIKIPEDAKVGDKHKMLVTVLYSDELYLDNRTAYETVWEVFEFEIIE